MTVLRTVFVNGEYVSEERAKISVFDRGFLFADGVYEVTAVLDAKLLDFEGHFARLQRSLAALEIKLEFSREELLAMHRELVVRNELPEGVIYLQISRGAADRDFAFPADDTPTSIVAFTQEKPLLNNPAVARGWKVITHEDLRWGRCDIKTVQLLYPSLAKMVARKKGADDAWLVRDGLVTEGTSNNAYIVLDNGEIVTRQLSHDILHGITRKAILACADQLGLRVVERAFSPEEACGAVEAFVTSAATLVMPVVEIDSHTIGDGRPGKVSGQLRALYLEIAREGAI